MPLTGRVCSRYYLIPPALEVRRSPPSSVEPHGCVDQETVKPMSAEFIARIAGMIIGALAGARLGILAAPALGIPDNLVWLLTMLTGALAGLILTPLLTVKPVRRLHAALREMPIESLIMAAIGTVFGLLIGLLLSYPLSLTGAPLSNLLPPVTSIVLAYVCGTTFTLRAREIWDLIGTRLDSQRAKMLSMQGSRQLLLDTSVLIDGRIVDIAKTGFVGGTLLVPAFVLAELHQVADSADMLRRNRGRRGLAKLNELQHSDAITVKIIEDDVQGITEVDHKLVALAQQLNAPIVTNDYNLNRVAEAQGVIVLNINLLANAVRTIYIPGETFPIHVIQEGRDVAQGVGYLEDGTMVVVENGRQYMDRTINVTVTRLINRETGRMIFAVPENERRSTGARDGSDS